MTENIPHPREANFLFGHEAAEAEFRAALASGRMHHAWLITGPKGIGKATFAYRAARAVLADGLWPVPENHPVFRRVAAGSHADFLALEPPIDPDKDEAKRDIPVEQARAAGEFLALTPGEGEWRVVIADSVDEMNVNATNALLKVLEEPPPRALLLLVSHNPGRLLPTIRSRCRMFRLPAPGPEAFAKAMRMYARELGEGDAERLGALSHFCPGAALALQANGGLDLYEAFVRLVGEMAAGGWAMPAGAQGFAESVASGQAHTRWQIMGQLAARFFERAMELKLTPAGFSEAATGEAAALKALLTAMPLHAVAGLHAAAAEQFSVASRLHLDYKTVLLGFVHSLARPQAA